MTLCTKVDVMTSGQSMVYKQLWFSYPHQGLDLTPVYQSHNAVVVRQTGPDAEYTDATDPETTRYEMLPSRN